MPAPVIDSGSLEALNGLLRRQRQALVAGDVGVVAQVSTALTSLMADAAAADGAEWPVPSGAGNVVHFGRTDLASAALRALRVNQALLRNGTAAADRFAASVAAHTGHAGSALLSEVA